MRRLALRLSCCALLLVLAGCAYSAGSGRPEFTGPSGPPITGATQTGAGPTGASAPGAPTDPSFTQEGCPIEDPAACEQATFLANALVLGSGDAVFDLSAPVHLECADLDPDLYAQCDRRNTLDGYLVGNHRGEYFVARAGQQRDALGFFVEAIDDEYSDELGGPEMQILGISTCGPDGPDRSYHVVYTVGLGDPNSTFPGDRFLGTYELVQQRGEWIVGATTFGLYTDWQLVLDDPLAEIACGDVEPWGA
jgi:hypothetical protein